MLIGPLQTNFGEIFIEIHVFLFKKWYFHHWLQQNGDYYADGVLYSSNRRYWLCLSYRTGCEGNYGPVTAVNLDCIYGTTTVDIFIPLTNGSYTSLFDLLLCLGHKQLSIARCKSVFDKGYSCWRCLMVKGNLLSTNVFGKHYSDAHVIFKVHNSFSINLTIKYSIPNTNEKFSGKARVRFYEGNNIWDIFDSDFPWSVVKKMTVPYGVRFTMCTVLFLNITLHQDIIRLKEFIR